MRTCNDLCEAAKVYTDKGGWYASWHWRRDKKWNYYTAETVEDALSDLHTGTPADMENEIHAATKYILRRYALAKEMREYLDSHKQEEL